MMIANATGCSSIYGGSAPSCPYTVNDEGKGPAWANSLFEDNAEYGYGMAIAVRQKRETLTAMVKELLEGDEYSEDLKNAAKEWLENKEDGTLSKESGEKFEAALEMEDVDSELLDRIYMLRDYYTKKSIWIVGGDGWAYDIGYGGLDHVLASGENVNVLVLDTEVYSNTGGQASKATPYGAIAKFAASGKKTKKKDLGLMAMTYGYVYVASVAMGADKNQLMKALLEAEKYDGPSLIIAYAPCINHGLDMGHTQKEEKLAVETGYWPLFRYNPLLKEEGKNPFVLEYKGPQKDVSELINNEVRYKSLEKLFPEEAVRLDALLKKDLEERYQRYKNLSEHGF